MDWCSLEFLHSVFDVRSVFVVEGASPWLTGRMTSLLLHNRNAVSQLCCICLFVFSTYLLGLILLQWLSGKAYSVSVGGPRIVTAPRLATQDFIFFLWDKENLLAVMRMTNTNTHIGTDTDARHTNKHPSHQGASIAGIPTCACRSKREHYPSTAETEVCMWMCVCWKKTGVVNGTFAQEHC